ncbi:plasmid-related protein (plasmid) [Sporosarcina psychrophila]|uniref:PBECR3 domain-containing polyvalent protein n=1 Tax=Sporosarcina psychrophila TaxID=1476 RepID=UPI0030D541F1
MSKIIINPYSTDTQQVGVLPKCLVTYYQLPYTTLDVWMPPGVLKHLKKRGHWEDLLAHHLIIPSAIENPDFAGQNPREPNSLELYKIIDDHLLIAIKMSPEKDLFLGSFYKLDNGQEKIQKRLRTGRIHPFDFFLNNTV